MCIKDNIDANGFLKHLQNLKAEIRFNIIEKENDMIICSFSDAAFNITSCQSYGQTGINFCISFDANRGRKRIFDPLDWTGSKQRRSSHSSYGAEKFACSDAEDGGYYVKQAIQNILHTRTKKHEINVNSKGLYDKITTLHEGRQYTLRQTVQRIRDSLESEELNTLKWIQGFANIAYALTKHNPNTFRLLSHVLSTGTLDLPNHEPYSLDSAEWK